jgi:hypothetical protein
LSKESSNQTDLIFKGIKRRMRTWIVSVASGVKEEELITLASNFNKASNQITFWDFLEYSYGIDEDVSIQTLLFFLAFESTVVSPSNQYVIKLLGLLSNMDGGEDQQLTALQELLNSTEISAQKLIKGS